MDIKEFYPSITKEILNKALNFAKNITSISDEEMRTIYHCRKSLLFFDNAPWKKKSTHECFDVTMGSFDGAEICELVGLFILNELTELMPNQDIGLYRDDGLSIIRNSTGPKADRKRKEIIRKFKEIGFQIEIAANLKIVDFLDITLDLNRGTYQPYKKPNDSLMYIHVSSNHPKQILDQLPKSINDRLSKNSSNEQIFNSTKPEYEEALRRSGFNNPSLSFTKSQPSRHRNRQRKTIWFNPPFNKEVQTNVAKCFLKLINKHFPRNHHLHKLFNRNNIKVSYSCTQNIGRIIKAHNKKLSTPPVPESLPCNCRRKAECPLNGDCRKTSVVYKCEVFSPDLPKKVYIGLTEKDFKTRYNSHTQSFRNKKYANSTTLSAHIWDTKENHHVTPTLKWSIIKRAPAYSNITKTCSLCLAEKYEILKYPLKEELLNKRSEIISKCRHMNKFLMANYKTKD